MELIKKNYLYFFLIFILFFLDRLSKNYIIEFFLNYEFEIYYLNSFLNFVLIWNKGMAFGLFAADSLVYDFFSLLVFIVIIVLILWFFKSKKYFEKFSISLVIGGAFGNLYDRIVYRAVPDFIDFHYLDFHWFVFNVSDIIISTGIVLLIVNDFLIKKDEQKS